MYQTPDRVEKTDGEEQEVQIKVEPKEKKSTGFDHTIH